MLNPQSPETGLINEKSLLCEQAFWQINAAA
jgi:hypothetical protein